MDFFSPYAHEFVRIAACVPGVAVADTRFNADETLALLRQGHASHVGVMVFPELGISAYIESSDAARVQAAIEVAIRRYREAARLDEKVGQLETALERRAVIERAKGIVMERHGID